MRSNLVVALTVTLVIALAGCGDDGPGDARPDSGGACTGCVIDGACVDAGAANPSNACELCEPGANPAGWSIAVDGAACDDGAYCDGADTCVAGSCVPEGDRCTGANVACYEAEAACGCAAGWTGEACDQCVVYVRASGDDGLDGGSWTDALASVEAAVAVAEPRGCAVWVAEGTYLPPPSTTGDPRGASFQLRSGMALYGGFAGTEWALDQRDLAAHVTTLSGDLGVADDPDDNSYHVVVGAAGATLDGFTIAHGNADGDANDRIGGGLYNAGDAVVVTRSTFTANNSIAGGGLYNSGESVVVASSTFTANTATTSTSASGGGLSNSGSLVVKSSTFSSNAAGFYGGGIYNSHAVVVTSTSFSGNSAPRGGALFSFDGSVVVTSSTFAANSAGAHGGGIYNRSGPVVITNSTFAANAASTYGGGVYNNDVVDITNSTFVANSADSEGGAIYNYDTGSLAVTSTIVRGQGGLGGALDGFGGGRRFASSNIEGGCPADALCTDVLDEDPLFVDAAGGDLRLAPGSPCVDAGDFSALPPDVADLDGDGDLTEVSPLDLDGNVRVRGGGVDIGAFESASTPCAAAGDGSGLGAECAGASCKGILASFSQSVDGDYWLAVGSSRFRARCDMTAGGFTLLFQGGTSFAASTPADPARTCYAEACTSGAYGLLPLGDDLRFDASSELMTGEDFAVRTTVTGIDPALVGGVLGGVFDDGTHYYVEADDNANVENVFTGAHTCDVGGLPFSEWSAIVCGSPVIELNDFGSSDSSCPGRDFLLGRAASRLAPWDNCAGWPSDVVHAGITYYPAFLRIWTR